MIDKHNRNFRILEFKNNKFDIIGDIHGCYDEFLQLLELLGYVKDKQGFTHPQGRRLISVGDVADKGFKNIECLELWMDLVAYNGAFWIHGNHCSKLYRYFLGNKVHVSRGMENTVGQYLAMSSDARLEFKNRYIKCYESQSYYLLLDKQRLAVVHGGLRQESIGKFSNRIKNVCLFGETTGRQTESGRPERIDWAAEYQGKPLVVYGHTVAKEAVFRNNTVDIDQGCVYGGKLTALRYPELSFVQVLGNEYSKFQVSDEKMNNYSASSIKRLNILNNT